MRYLILLAILALSACDSSDNTGDNTRDQVDTSQMLSADEDMTTAATPDVGITYSDANISFNFPESWRVTPDAERNEIYITTQKANEVGTLDGCFISFFERPNETLVELTLAYAENQLMPNPAPTITYLTVNNQEVSRIQGWKQVAFSAAPVLIQVMYENDIAAPFYCATIDLDDDIKLMFDSAVLQ